MDRTEIFIARINTGSCKVIFGLLHKFKRLSMRLDQFVKLILSKISDKFASSWTWTGLKIFIARINTGHWKVIFGAPHKFKKVIDEAWPICELSRARTLITTLLTQGTLWHARYDHIIPKEILQSAIIFQFKGKNNLYSGFFL